LAANGDHLKKVALELGGNAPFVVLDDADVDQAIRAAVVGRFLHQGEICMSVNRIIVDTKIYDEFADKFVERVRGLKYGDPNDPETATGPIINKRQLDGMLHRIEQARSSGIKQVLGGEPHGLVLPPQIFLEVGNGTDLAQTEQIVPLIRVNGEAEALHIANDSQYGLSSAVFTRDEARGLRFALQLQDINDMSANDAPNNPFGGKKNSGIGRFAGEWIIEEFTTDHLITVQHEPLAYPF
jgi:aldehyde dehydrogenase (NAD+)